MDIMDKNREKACAINFIFINSINISYGKRRRRGGKKNI